MGLLLPPPSDDDDGLRRGSHPHDADAHDWPPLDLSRPLDVVVPDDLSDLEDEVRAVQLELSGRARMAPPRGRLARLRSFFSPTPYTPGVPMAGRPMLVGPLVALVLLFVAGLVALFPPMAVRQHAAAPLPPLARTVKQPGTLGGLLPDVTVTSSTGSFPVRSLRPAVLLLAPDGCGCAALIRQVMGQVEEAPGLAAVLVATGNDSTVTGLAVAPSGGDGRLRAVTDRSGVLFRTYAGASGRAPTLLLVAGNGLLTRPPLTFSSGDRIEGDLLPLRS